MLSAILTLVIVLLIIGVLYWGLTEILKVLPIPEPFATVIRVLLIVAACIAVIVYGLAPLLDAPWALRR